MALLRMAWAMWLLLVSAFAASAQHQIVCSGEAARSCGASSPRGGPLLHQWPLFDRASNAVAFRHNVRKRPDYQFVSDTTPCRRQPGTCSDGRGHCLFWLLLMWLGPPGLRAVAGKEYQRLARIDLFQKALSQAGFFSCAGLTPSRCASG